MVLFAYCYHVVLWKSLHVMRKCLKLRRDTPFPEVQSPWNYQMMQRLIETISVACNGLCAL